MRFASRLTLDSGKRLRLEPFQLEIVRPYFEGRLETVAILPVGNAKSTLLAVLGLHHMLTTDNAMCIIAASAADQAAVIFGQMAGLVEDSDLPLEAQLGVRSVKHPLDPLPSDPRDRLAERKRREESGETKRKPGRIKVISADARKNSGAIPTLVLVDELQAHPDGYLYNMLRQRLRKRGAQMVSISNAGWDRDSFLAQLRQEAHDHSSFTRGGPEPWQQMRNRALVGQREFLEWCLAEGDDPNDIATVKLANPLRAVTRRGLEEDHASLLRAEWLRGACGLWTPTQNPFITPEVWDSLRVDIGRLVEGDEVVCAIRTGAAHGIGIVAPRGDGRVAVASLHIPAPPTGRAALADAERALLDVSRRYNVLSIGYDPDQFRRSAELLSEKGLPMMTQPQRPQGLAQATATFWRLVSGGLLMHDGDETLRDQVLATVTTETTSGWRIDPRPNTSTVAALAMAAHRATQVEPEPPMVVAL